jgi:hypothetical protein
MVKVMQTELFIYNERELQHCNFFALTVENTSTYSQYCNYKFESGFKWYSWRVDNYKKL